MTISELLEKLEQYNLEANVDVLANNRKYEFSLAYGGGDGETKENCNSVSIYVDDLNKAESC